MKTLKVLFKDPKNKEIKLVAENLDDIWHLYNLIEEGDLVRAVCFRTDDQKDDKIRSKKSEKKKMKLGIRIEKINFHEFSDRLRLHGTIEEGPQDLGSYHTLNIEADKMNSFSIVKDNWKHHHLERIDEAVKQRKQPLLIFVSLDEDEATVAILRQSGIQKIADISSKKSGKMYDCQDTSKDYFGEIFSVLKTVKKEESPVVVIGPGFTREHFIKEGKQKYPDIFENCRTHATGHSEMNGINEAIKQGVVDQITKENRVAIETKFVEKVFEEIKKDGLVSYGESQVVDALENGAVERLLISDLLVRRDNGIKILEIAKNTNSKFTIINTMHEAGKKFEGIGGIAALLRFKI